MYFGISIRLRTLSYKHGQSYLGLGAHFRCYHILRKLNENSVSNVNPYTIRKLSDEGSGTISKSNNEIPEYPPILPSDQKSIYIRDRDNKLDKIKNLDTVEEKLMGINIPRYYGWNSLILNEGSYPFNFMPFAQHITRTDFIEVEKLPFSCSQSQSEIENVINKIRPILQEAIIVESSKTRYNNEITEEVEATLGEGELSDVIAKGAVEQINRVLSVNLVQHAPHLYETEVDFEPRIEAFWRVGGFYPDQKTYDERKKDKKDHEKELKRNRFAKRKIEEEPEDLLGHFIQYLGNPILQLRHSKPLKVLEPQPLPPTEAGVENATRYPDLARVPVLRYDPGFYGLEKFRRHGTNIPGFWPGDPNEFGLLSYLGRGHLIDRPPSFGEEDLTHTVNAQAILSGYAWLLGQANYQGFSTFHDITYPITTTTIITDGRVFSFFASQLNTLLFHDEFIDINPKVNVCYGLPTLELYQKIEGNEIIGWDDRVLSLLVSAYLNAPEERAGIDLKPYLNKAVPYVKNIEQEERRNWLHNQYRFMASNRTPSRLVPEIYDWEMIYKVKFDTRPFDAKRRFFEIGVDPFKRRMDDCVGSYIPKKFRDPKNYKKRNRDQFWPNC